MSPNHAPAGGSFTASVQPAPADQIIGYVYYWDAIDDNPIDGRVLGTAQVPASPPPGYTSVTNLTVPVLTPPDNLPVAVGQHNVFIMAQFAAAKECYSVADFTVDPPSVQQNAYGSTAAPASSLPSTGFFLLIPAAGLGIGGLGGVLLRRRRRTCD